MKKFFGVLLVGMLFFAVSEALSIAYLSWQAYHFPSTPASPDAFGDYEKFLDWTKNIGYVQEYLSGSGQIYSPYTATINRPNYSSKIKNFNIEINERGFRAKKILTPKPKNVFRVFLLGGSTAVQGINEDVTISHYLEENLKKTIPNVEVINAGVAGYASDNELILLETEILQLEPDLVVVLDGRNDIYYAAYPQACPAFQMKQTLDVLANYPKMTNLLLYSVKTGFRKSRFLMLAFRTLFRSSPSTVYPRQTSFDQSRIKNYIHNLTLMKSILEADKVKGVIVFQPTLGFCKNQLSAYEQTTFHYHQSIEKTDWLNQVKSVWPQVATEVRKISNSNLVKIYDFSCLFKDNRETVYYDSCHYVPRACKQIADQLAIMIKNGD